jgi:tetratricopeptide (TPR) repeat protein
MRIELIAGLVITLAATAGPSAQERPSLPPQTPTSPPSRQQPGAKVQPTTPPSGQQPGAAVQLAADGSPALSTDDLAARVLAMVVGWQTGPAAEILERDGTRLEGRVELKIVHGLIQAQHGDLEGGLKTLAAASADHTADPAPEYYRGEILYWQRRDAESRQAWSSSLQRARTAAARYAQTPTPRADQPPPAPDRARASVQYYLGTALIRQKEYAKAREELVRALSLGFNPVMIRHQIALSHLFEQQWQPARETFDQVIAADPRFAPAYYYRGMAWDKLGRKDNLLLDMDQFLALAPNAPEAGRARSVVAASRR